MFNPEGALERNEKLTPIEETSKDIKLDKNTVNLFALLKQSNGVQSIELANLASVLGSEVHVSVADYLFEKIDLNDEV